MRYFPVVLALYGLGVVTLFVGVAIQSEMLETIGAWLMVPITVVFAALLAVFLLATAARPFAAAAQRVLRRRAR